MASSTTSTGQRGKRPSLTRLPSTEREHDSIRTPSDSKGIRVFCVDEPALRATLGKIEPGGEPIIFASAGESTGIALSLRQAARLLRWLRLRAGIPLESELFISDPASGRLIPVPNDEALPRPGHASQAVCPTLRYRLECKIFCSIITIDVHEKPKRIVLPPPDDTSKKRRVTAKRIVELLAKPPSPEYEQLCLDLTELTHCVQHEVAVRLAPALKNKMRALPHETYAEKQDLTKWVNGELRRYGLAVRWNARKKVDDGFEERAYPACLVTDVGNHPKEGRFQVQYRDEDGKLMKPLSTPDLTILIGHLEVIVDDPQRHRTGKWTDRAARVRADPER